MTYKVGNNDILKSLIDTETTFNHDINSTICQSLMDPNGMINNIFETIFELPSYLIYFDNKDNLKSKVNYDIKNNIPYLQKITIIII